MFEAYKIGVRISLISNVSTGLLAMANHFKLVGAQADVLQAKLSRLKVLGIAGFAVGAAGFAGLDLIGKLVEPAEDYAHQINIMNMAGLKHAEIVKNIAAAWKTTHSVITTNATENIKDLMDMRSIFGHSSIARAELPLIEQIKSVLIASNETRVSGQASNFAYSMTKALDMLGLAKDPSAFNASAQMMARTIIATRGRVAPRDYQMMFKYMRQGAYNLDSDFLFKEAPELMLEYKTSSGASGSRGGIGAMYAAAYRQIVQGMLNRQSAYGFWQLGLVPKSASVLGTTTNQTSIMGGLVGEKTFERDPVTWVKQTYLPALLKKLNLHDFSIKSRKDENVLIHATGQLFKGNQLSNSFIDLILKQLWQIQKFKRLWGHTMTLPQAYHAAITSDPRTMFTALSAQWENLKVSLGRVMIPGLLVIMRDLSRGLNDMARLFAKNSWAAKGFVYTLTGLFALMAAGGTAMGFYATFKGVGLILAVIPRVTAGLAVFGSALAGLLPTLAVLGSVLAGYKIGGVLLGRMNHWAAHHTHGRHTTVGGWFASTELGAGIAHHVLGINGPDPQSFIHRGPTTVHVTTHLHVDGRKLATAVTKHQSEMGHHPQRGRSGFDFNMAPAPVGMGL